MIYPVVMAGGSGTRLWPLSRQNNPKQFLSLIDKKLSMLQTTLSRLNGLELAPPCIICNDEHRFLVAEQLRKLGIDNAIIILEPVAKNTAPAVTLSALMLNERSNKKGEDPTILVLSADHDIQNIEAFHRCIQQGLKLAEDGKLVAFGISPTRPETGFGYIKKGEKLHCGSHIIEQFVEKPDMDTAVGYISSGDYLWNSGIFMFRASRFLDEIGLHRPDILSACSESFSEASNDMFFIRIGEESFKNCPSESIDYAVMEKTNSAVVVPASFEWNDVGSWESLWCISEKDEYGNVLIGDVLTYESRNNYIRSESRLVTTVGISDLIVVETKDAVFVSTKNNAKDVRNIVDMLHTEERPEYQVHREVYRPWGVYDSIDQGARYQVKKITVNPGARLSLQMHHHRSEHWIVVKGTARVTCGQKTYLVTENQSTYIPIGEVHSLENPGVVPLELIEVQSGSYLGEDDIVRLEDNYGRASGKDSDQD